MPSSTTATGEKSYLAKIGMILLKITDQGLVKTLDGAWEADENHSKYYQRVIEIHKEVEEVLRKCPDVKELKRLGELRLDHFEPFDHQNAAPGDYFLQESSSVLSFDLFLPKSERKYAFDVRYEENVIEKAHVIYNGVFFLAFAEIDDDPSTAMFGQEIREFLAGKLVTDRWKSVAVPPCPLHPEITLSISSDIDKLEVACDEYNDIEISLPPILEDDEPLSFFCYFLEENSFSTMHFLSICTLQQRLENNSRQIEEMLETLTADYVELLSLSWYQLAKKLNLMHSARKNALSLQVACNQFARDQLSLKQGKDSFDPENAETWNRNAFRSYFYSHFRSPALTLSEIRETVKHMTDIVSQTYLQYVTFFAAVAGGIIGAIITNIPFVVSLFSKLPKK